MKLTILEILYVKERKDLNRNRFVNLPKGHLEEIKWLFSNKQHNRFVYIFIIPESGGVDIKDS